MVRLLVCYRDNPDDLYNACIRWIVNVKGRQKGKKDGREGGRRKKGKKTETNYCSGILPPNPHFLTADSDHTATKNELLHKSYLKQWPYTIPDAVTSARELN